MVTRDEFRSSMGRFATGVTVVTTLDDKGELHGMTANAFTSVSLDPPLVLVCVDFAAYTHGFVEARGSFGINILSDQQKDIAEYFASKPEYRHEKAPYVETRSHRDLPIIDEGLVFLGCEVVDSHIHGDHSIYVAEVKELLVTSEDGPLLFYNGQLTNLSARQL